MRQTRFRFARACCIGLLTTGLIACGRRDEAATENTQLPAATAPAPSAAAPTASALRVAGVQVGQHVGADKRVTHPTTQFGTRDTIYASVATEGTGANATLAARWTFEDGQVVDQSTETISPNGPAVTEFHISKPSGWPKGRYKVMVSLNGTPADSADFQVQ